MLPVIFLYVLAVTGIIFLLLAVAYMISPKPAGHISYLTPDNSKKYNKPGYWKGTPVDSKGRFVNEEYPFYQDYLKILTWLPGHLRNLVKNRKEKFPVVHHDSPGILEENDTIIWLGHASFFLRIMNVNILVDPHFYNTFIYKRHTDNPIPPGLFLNIQYILLSHDHADHCDKKSLQLLTGNNPGVIILCGLNMEVLIQSFAKGKVDIKTAEWYQQFPLPQDIDIYFVPGRHYSKRVFEKFNSRLWGGFIIRYKSAHGNFKTIYYGGDSGYGNHFKEIKNLFEPGIAILPIGAYKPRWFMKPNHMSPEEAVQAFKDCGAEKMIPMHFSTFNLSNENMGEPRKVLNELARTEELINLKPGSKYKMTYI